MGATRAIELVRVTKEVRALVCDGQIDTVISFLVHANTVAAIAAQACPGVRFVQSIQTTQPRPRWHWWVQRWVARSADAIVVPSPSTAQAARERADVPAAKIVVIPNAINLADFPSVRGGAEIQTIGFLGRLDPVKRVNDLIDALALLDERFKLLVFGDGSERPSLEAKAANLALTNRVSFRGAVAAPQEALAEIDLLVLPSSAEGFGLVLIEAMAARVPVIATNVAGIRDVTQHERTGLLVPVKRPDAIAQAIVRLAEDESLRNHLIDNAVRDVRDRFTWEVVLPQYRQLLRLEREST